MEPNVSATLALSRLQAVVAAVLHVNACTEAHVTESTMHTHDLCVALEAVLQCALKPSFFGARREYYAYVVECLGTQQELVASVNACTQHRTDAGKGRCFIRMALQAKQLAETMQVPGACLHDAMILMR